MKSLGRLVSSLSVAAALTVGVHGTAHAGTGIFGELLKSNGGPVTVKYLGSNAAFFNTMQWFKGGYGSVVFNGDVVNYAATPGVQNLFYNKTIPDAGITATTVPTVVDLGYIGYGTEVLLALFVNNEKCPVDPESATCGDAGTLSDWQKQDANDYTYFVGPASRNRDNAFHVRFEEISAGVFRVQGGWEDRVNGGDLDYNDMMFEVSGVHVTPEPVSMALLGTGLAGLAGIGRRRRKQQETEDA